MFRICSTIKKNYVYAFYHNPGHDDSLYDCLLDSMARVQSGDNKAKTLVKLQCSAPCISSYNMKATMYQQLCKSGSSKIYKFIVGRLYVLLRRAHCSHHMATYNM